MGVIVRQKTKGRGQPWWVFVSHNGKRTSRKVGDRQAAEKVGSEIRAKLQLGECGLEEKKPVPTYVFTDRRGGPIDKDNWRSRIFKRELSRAGLRKIRIHDLRHGYATMRIFQGHNIADVSKQLGHHSIKLTLDTYFHWIPGGSKSEVDALDDVYEGQEKVVDRG